MNKVLYAGEVHFWDLLFSRIGEEIDSKYLGKDFKDDLKEAYNNVSEVNILADLRKIVDRYYSDESDDYSDNFDDMENPDSHIYHSLVRLNNFLKEN